MKHNSHSRSFIPLVFLFLFLYFVPSAYSHPGDTDANGGHYVKDTGEYHYHHGYPAHQHSDLDGDGKPDCPYDFKDKNSSSSSESSAFNPEFMERVHKLRENRENASSFSRYACLIVFGGFAVLALDTYRDDIIDWLKSLFNKNSS